MRFENENRGTGQSRQEFDKAKLKSIKKRVRKTIIWLSVMPN
jgi:hypothetical protein